jgi:hypothetical protein
MANFKPIIRGEATQKKKEAAEALAHPQHPARRPGSSQFCWLNKSRQEIEKENDENGYKTPRAHIIYTPMSNGKKR